MEEDIEIDSTYEPVLENGRYRAKVEAGSASSSRSPHYGLDV